MTTNTDKLSALPFAVFDEFGNGCDDRIQDHISALLEAAGRVQQAEPVAVLRFQRGTPGHENDMPAVVSCNWLPDGDYWVYLANINTVEALVRDVELEHGRGVANPKARAAHSPASGVVEREALALDIKSAIAELASGAVYPDLLEAIDKLAALATQPLEQKPVHQWRKKGSMSYTWHDGHPDPEDGGGPYETRTLFGKAQPEQVAQDEPDMFWDHDDGERFGHDISEIIADYGPGEIVKIDQAKRLPSVTVRVLPAKDDDSDLEYEFIENDRAARASGQKGNTP